MKSQFKFVESTERKHYMFYIYIIFDFAMAVIMLLFGIWFYRSKGQASNFLSGYNMKSAEERKKYDENAMCKAYGKRMMLMSLPFIAGMIIDIWYIGTGCLIAWAFILLGLASAGTAAGVTVYRRKKSKMTENKEETEEK